LKNYYDFDDILYEKKDGVGWLTINRPDVLNAMRRQTYEELLVAFKDVADDDSIGVSVLTGAGDRAFCSGGDVNGQLERTTAIGRKHQSLVIDLAAAMRNSGKPIIAAVNGYAIGGGHELHLLCDVTISSDRAVYGQSGPRVGSVPVWGATQLLPHIVGEKRAREIVFWCRKYTADEAYAMGLVNKVVPHSELYTEVGKWCSELLDKSPQSIRLARTALNFSSDLLYPAYTHGMEMLSLINGNEENLEGVRAFLGKRSPNYRRYRKAPDED
jgi:dihydroxynaphthoic acid synthetase